MVMEVRPEQPEKQMFPKLVTLSGMVMEVRPEQPEKQRIPKLVTLSGMVMEVREEQQLYLLLVDYQYYTF